MRSLNMAGIAGLDIDSSPASRIALPEWSEMALAVRPIFGSDGQGGFHTAGDVLVDKTADGVPLNQLWDTLGDLLGAWRAKQDALLSLLAFDTTDVAEAVPQSLSHFQFEEASEFGEPRAGQGGDSLILGYGFKDYDLATRYTWKYLRDATARQVEFDMNASVEADQRLRTGKVLGRLFNPAQKLTPEGNSEFGLWNGTDGIAPIEYLGKTFASNHAHYLVSGASVIDSADIEDSISLITEHGYGTVQGSRILVLASENTIDTIMGFRKGEESRAPVSPETTGPIAKYDAIPSADNPPYLSSEFIVGQTPPSEYNNLRVAGSYGAALLVPHIQIPDGYVLTVATSGANSAHNVVGMRHHVNTAYRGLRQIPGKGQYPLIDMFFQRSFGVGVRHRGAAVVTQIKAAGTYDAPTIAS
ncbi:hypothetical protein [Mycolicibacterium mageritense]|uniref:hypothetical protein n=1 Tax=Mycolicibacterium mageritense TaxID=53462 RepID=UPI001E38B96F|nr:hypothetical protein [Mycolicibacterium mageritense]MCC9186935.1 hypothetical protein [Mycolicibacterium mageritense]